MSFLMVPRIFPNLFGLGDLSSMNLACDRGSIRITLDQVHIAGSYGLY